MLAVIMEGAQQDQTIKWAARTGYQLRVFCPMHIYGACHNTLAQARIEHYISFDEGTLIGCIGDPLDMIYEVAAEEGRDLIVFMRADMVGFMGKRVVEDILPVFVREVGAARIRMGADMTLGQTTVGNPRSSKKIVMVRVNEKTPATDSK